MSCLLARPRMFVWLFMFSMVLVDVKVFVGARTELIVISENGEQENTSPSLLDVTSSDKQGERMLQTRPVRVRTTNVFTSLFQNGVLPNQRRHNYIPASNVVRPALARQQSRNKSGKGGFRSAKSRAKSQSAALVGNVPIRSFGGMGMEVPIKRNGKRRMRMGERNVGIPLISLATRGPFPNGFRPAETRGPTKTPAPSTAAPSVLSAPSSPGQATTTAPTGLPSPATPTASTAPAAPTAPLNSKSVVVISDFNLGYFNNSPNRDLTAAEYTELANDMNAFYTNAFQNDPTFSPTFQSYSTNFTSMTYNAGSSPQIMTVFDANFVFSADSTATKDSVLAKMQSLDYMAFITQYLQGPPIDQLDEVQSVTFMAASSQH